MFGFVKKDRYKNDGVFLNNGNGTLVVLYSKYKFFKKGDVIKFNVLCEYIIHYKRVLITNETLEEEM